MTTLVTGGCGFIGSHLTRALINDGEPVIVLDDLSTGKPENLPAGAELVVDDIVRDGAFSMLDHVDRIFHLAAIASVERSRLDWYRTHQVNSGGTVNLFHSIARLNRPIPVVYASSAAVYGDCSELPIHEELEPSPLSAYGVDKLSCEWHGNVAANLHRIPNMGLRFFNVYGPGQDPNSPYSGVISIFMEQAAREQSLVIYGGGEQTRDFVYVKDVVLAMRRAMGKLEAGEVLTGMCNVGTGTPVSISALAEHIRKVSGKSFNIQHAPARQGDIRHSYCDPQHAAHYLGFSPQYPIEQGLALTYGAVAV